MTQRTMLMVAAAVTTCILVVAGALAGRLTDAAPADVAAADPMLAPAAPLTATSYAEREAAYQAAIAEANRRLELANQQLAQQGNAAIPAANIGPAVSAEQAQMVALEAAPGATLVRPAELVRYQGTPAYEVVLDRGTVYIDAERATVLATGASSGPITAEQVAQAAQTYRGDGQVREVEQEHERGGTVYEVTFSDGGTVYVDANSGQVVYAQLGHPEHGEGEHGEGEHDEDD